MDPFKLESDTYSPNEFYIASRDKSRDSEVIRLRLPGHTVGQIAAMIQQRQCPAYRTREDFFRDAVIHRLQWLVDSDWPTDAALEVALAQERAKSRTEMSRWIAEIEDDTVNNLTIIASREIANPNVARVVRQGMNELLTNPSPNVRDAAMNVLNKLDRP